MLEKKNNKKIFLTNWGKKVTPLYLNHFVQHVLQVQVCNSNSLYNDSLVVLVPCETHIGKSSASNLLQVFENLLGICRIDEGREVKALSRVNVSLVLDGLGLAEGRLVTKVELVADFTQKRPITGQRCGLVESRGTSCARKRKERKKKKD